LVALDGIGEQPARTGKKRRFDEELIQDEVQWLNGTIDLAYYHARKRQNPPQGLRAIVARIREQKCHLEKTMDARIWDEIETTSGYQSSVDTISGPHDVDPPASSQRPKGEL
jgi:hypothetical protein